MSASPLSSPSPDIAPRPTSGELFMGFFWLGVTAFGGVLPLARAMLVERRRWLSEQEFIDLLGLCQFLPGGNIINMSVAVGMQFRGARGALASVLGLIAAPTIIVILLGMVYDRFQDDPHLQHFFAGMAAAAAGLLVGMAVKVVRPLRGNYLGMAVAWAGFGAIAWLRLPLVPTMLVLAPISIFLAWRTRQ